MEPVMLSTMGFSIKYGVPLTTVYNWCRTGKLSTLKLKGRRMIPDDQGKPVKNSLGCWEFVKDGSDEVDSTEDENQTFTSWTVFVSRLDHAAYLKHVLLKTITQEFFVFTDDGPLQWKYGFGIAVPTTIAKRMNDVIVRHLSVGEIPYLSGYDDEQDDDQDDSGCGYVVERIDESSGIRDIRYICPTRDDAISYCKENGYYDKLIHLFRDPSEIEYVYEIREVPFNVSYAANFINKTKHEKERQA